MVQATGNAVSEENDSQNSDIRKEDEGEPSLGPACAFFFLAACAFGSVALIATAWYISGNQAERASAALRSQLIPWVEISTLAPIDKAQIIERLNELVADMDAERLNERQLSRLNFRLSGAPIFQWGVVEQIIAAVNQNSELSSKEKEDFGLETDRLLRTVQNGRLSMEQLQFATQPVAQQEVKTGRLSLRENPSTKELQECSRRITSLNDEAKTVKGSMDKSVSQVFRAIMEEALEVPPDR
jgi:hypothetical protein